MASYGLGADGGARESMIFRDELPAASTEDLVVVVTPVAAVVIAGVKEEEQPVVVTWTYSALPGNAHGGSPPSIFRVAARGKLQRERGELGGKTEGKTMAGGGGEQ